VRDVLAKSLGSPTHINAAQATMNALMTQHRPDAVAKRRGKTAEEVLLGAARRLSDRRVGPGLRSDS
jgi:ribosomal protein S5